MSVSANPVARGGSFGSGSGILAGRLGGPQFGIVAIGVDVGATNLFRRISAESILAGKQINKFNSVLAVTGNVLGSVLKSMSLATVGIAGAAFMVKEFDDNLARISAISGKDATDVMATIGDEAIRLSKSLGISASEISNAAITVVQAGFTLEETAKILEPLVQFGAATGGDVQKAAKLGIDAITTFNLEAEDATRVFNNMAFAINNAKVDVVTLSQGFNQAASSAAQLGATLESTLAVLGALGTAGLAGSPGGTGIKTGLLDLLSPAGGTAEFNKEIGAFKGALASTGDIVVSFDVLLNQLGTNLQEFGKTIGDVRGEIKDFTTATDEQLQEVVDKFGVLGSLTEIFGKRAVRSFLALGVVAEEALAQTVGMEIQLERVSDAAERATQTISAQAGRIRAQFVGELLGGEFRKGLTETLTEIAESDAGERLGAAFNDVIMDSLVALSENVDDIIELIEALADGASIFGDALNATVPVVKTLLSIIQVIPDPLLSAAVALKVVNTLFGTSVTQAFSLIAAQKSLTAEEAAQVKLELEQLAISANMLAIKRQQLIMQMDEAALSAATTGTTAQEVSLMQMKASLEAKELAVTKIKLQLEQKALIKKIDSGKLKGLELNLAEAELAASRERFGVLVSEAPIRKQILQNEITLLEVTGGTNAAHQARIIKLKEELALINAQEAGLARQRAGLTAPATRVSGVGRGAGVTSALIIGAVAVAGLSSLAISMSRLKDSVDANTESQIAGNEPSNELTAALNGTEDALIDTSQKLTLIGTVFTEKPLEPGQADFGIPNVAREDIVGINVASMTEEQLRGEGGLFDTALEAGTQLLDVHEALEAGYINLQQQEQILRDMGDAHVARVIANRSTEEQANITYVARSNSVFGNAMKQMGIAVINAAKLVGGILAAAAQSWWTLLKSTFDTVLGTIIVGVGVAIQLIESMFTTMVNTLVSVVNRVGNWADKFIPGDAFQSFGTIESSGMGGDTIDKGRSMLVDAALAVQDIPDLWTDDALILGNAFELAAEETEQFANTMGDTDDSSDDYLIAVRTAKTAAEFMLERQTEFAKSLGDFTPIIHRIMDASIHTVNGIDTLTGTFFELNNTGVDLAKGMGLFTDFLHLQTKVKIFEELSSVFTTMGIAVPNKLADVGAELNRLLFQEGLSIADLFSGENFDSNAFIEILAKAMDSPRFEQNNNIVVRISASGNTQNATEIADQVVRKITKQGVPTRPGGN